MTEHHPQLIIIGGGLAALTAATYLGRAGYAVHLFEQGKTVGGRARTQEKKGYLFNLGAHALYKDGAGVHILRELGIPFSGHVPKVRGVTVHQGDIQPLPDGPLGLLKTKFLGWRAKLEIATLLASFANIDPTSVRHLTVEEWLNQKIKQPETKQLLKALFRVATYANAPSQQSAEAAITQFQMVLAGNVYYLDGGWQTLVDALQQAAISAGVTINTGTRIEKVEREGNLIRGVTLANGTFYPADAILMTTNPSITATLLADTYPAAQAWAQQATPITAACLDLALTHLPNPKITFGVGIDQPLYLSVHSTTAQLAPEGGTLIHLLKYLPAAQRAPRIEGGHLAELEQMADLLQPGWRDAIIERRFLPKIVVSNRLVTAKAGGFVGRPTSHIDNIPNLFLAGDWIGEKGLLADATFASAKQAATLCLAKIQNPKSPVPEG